MQSHPDCERCALVDARIVINEEHIMGIPDVRFARSFLGMCIGRMTTRRRPPRRRLLKLLPERVGKRAVKCHWCYQMKPAAEISVDHLLPQSWGGKDEAGNLVAACVPCNLKRNEVQIIIQKRALAQARAMLMGEPERAVG